METRDVELDYLSRKLRKILKEIKEMRNGDPKKEEIARNLAVAIGQRLKDHPALKDALQHPVDIAQFIHPKDTERHPMVT